MPPPNSRTLTIGILPHDIHTSIVVVKSMGKSHQMLGSSGTIPILKFCGIVYMECQQIVKLKGQSHSQRRPYTRGSQKVLSLTFLAFFEVVFFIFDIKHAFLCVLWLSSLFVWLFGIFLKVQRVNSSTDLKTKQC